MVAAAKASGEARLISTANLNAYVNRFGGVMNWAINEGYLDRNPLKWLKLPDPVKKRDKRNPFSTEQLRRIFDAPIYTGCRDDANGYAIPGDQRPRRARFWVPLIALFSGLLLNEICQLEVSDIREMDGVACFNVTSGVSLTGDEKRVKTNASERVVPVHDELIRCGFLAFAASQRLCGETNLFPELPFGHLGYRSTAISRWFTRFLENADAKASADRMSVPQLARPLNLHVLRKHLPLYYGHFFCHVLHQDYVLKLGSDAATVKRDMLALLDIRGAEYPAGA
ncbi:hypothetical protein [Sphingomonas sp. GC_Shp_3]|uniref:site-specific integrase n=1 Tax=Sphingomonas sp. GC_Shp_3 TaxID=2937383 RepID=UPI002269CEE8